MPKRQNNIQLLSRFNFDQRTEYRRTNIGIVFQEYNLFDYLNVSENIELALMIKNENFRNTSEIEKLLQICNIEHRKTHKVKQLSGGEKQRVQIAVALAGNSRIILADEPTGNLDSNNSKNIFELFQKINHDMNTTILVVSHNIVITEYTSKAIKIIDGELFQNHLE